MRLIIFLFLLFVINVKSQTKNNFYPDGYYFTNLTIKNTDWNFEWLSIMTEPIHGLKNDVSVRFLNSKTKKWIDISTKDYFISHDSSIFNFNNNLIGQLTFTGHFTCSKPPLQDNKVVAKQT
ncbi:MAG: hypothetical protein KGL19_06090, partial [Bacteroidota bacterium]|nr:hypothetical protein [Bacteroidota bacterium]